MEDPKRFLRYVMPGILFAAQTAFLLWIVYPTWTKDGLRVLAGASLGAALAGVVTSGVLGYVFATFHHFLHWYSPTDHRIIDHTEKIKDLRERGLLDIEDDKEHIDRLKAFDIMTAEWFKRNQENTFIGNATARAAAFSDLAHGAGTARVASAASLLTVLIACPLVGIWSPSLGPAVRLVGIILVGVALVSLFHYTYRRTGGMAQRFYDRVLETTLIHEHKLATEAANKANSADMKGAASD
ncbi:MAG: hypothetical protein GXY19_08205 [Phycisphaerae bacterium]|nr:hypothetical protein [Phycisphaerae bacterium]